MYRGNLGAMTIDVLIGLRIVATLIGVKAKPHPEVAIPPGTIKPQLVAAMIDAGSHGHKAAVDISRHMTRIVVDMQTAGSPQLLVSRETGID